MPLSGSTFIIQPTQAQATLNTYITVFNVAIGGSGNAIEILGSGSKTIAISKIFIGKPNVGITLKIRKQSSASTGGTSTTTTLVPLNSNNAAATSVVRQYTVAPTAGTLVGLLYQNSLLTSDSDTIVFADTSQAQNAVLNSATETLAINVDAAVTIFGFIEWTEYS